MHRLKIFLVVIAIITIAFVYVGNSATSSSTIVFDTSTGFFGIDSESSVGMSLLRDELMLEGFDATDNVLMNIEGDEITNSLISRSNVLVLVNPNREFNKNEINLIKNFVNDGGKLLLVSDSPESSEYMNDISKIFGGEFLGYYSLGYGPAVTTNNENFSSAGVNTLYLITPIPIKVLEPDISISARTLAREWFSRWELSGEVIKEGDFMIFAGKSYGKGKVAFLGDKDILLNDNIIKYDNLPFSIFLFNWLEGREPRMIRAGSIPTFVKISAPEGQEKNVTLIIKNWDGFKHNVSVLVENLSFVKPIPQEFLLYDEYAVNLMVQAPNCIALSPGSENQTFYGSLIFQSENAKYKGDLIVEVFIQNDTLKYSPESLEFVVVENKLAINTLTLTNIGNVDQTIKLMMPEYLADVTILEKEEFLLPVNSTQRVRITVKEGNYVSVHDYLTIKRAYGCHAIEEYLPIKITPS